MAKVSLVNSSKMATIDDDNADYMSQFTWYLTEAGYACRLIKSGLMIYMHDEVWVRAHGGTAPVRSQSSDPLREMKEN